MATAASHRLSLEEFLALPEDRVRRELIRGEHVVSPSPTARHGLVVRELEHALRDVIGEREDVFLMALQADLRMSQDTIVQPDLFLAVVPLGWQLDDWKEFPVPDLVIEVLSPSTGRRDRGVKRAIYLEAGVREYWIVDPVKETLEQWRSGETSGRMALGQVGFDLGRGVAGTLLLAPVFARVRRWIRE